MAEESKRRFEHPVACERQLLKELAGACSSRINIERLALVYSHLLLKADEEPGFKWSYRQWAKALPWLSEKQIRDAFSQLEELGYVIVGTATGPGKCNCYYIVDRVPEFNCDPQGQNIVTLKVSNTDPQGRNYNNNDLKDFSKTKKEPAQPEQPRFIDLAEEIHRLQDNYIATVTTAKSFNTIKRDIHATARMIRLIETDGQPCEETLKMAKWLFTPGKADSGDFNWTEVMFSVAQWRTRSKTNGRLKYQNAYSSYLRSLSLPRSPAAGSDVWVPTEKTW